MSTPAPPPAADLPLVLARFEHERAIFWHLIAADRLQRRGRPEAALRHVSRAVGLVLGRPDPVAGHAARLVLGGRR